MPQLDGWADLVRLAEQWETAMLVALWEQMFLVYKSELSRCVYRGHHLG